MSNELCGCKTEGIVCASSNNSVTYCQRFVVVNSTIILFKWMRHRFEWSAVAMLLMHSSFVLDVPGSSPGGGIRLSPFQFLIAMISAFIDVQFICTTLCIFSCRMQSKWLPVCFSILAHLFSPISPTSPTAQTSPNLTVSSQSHA